MNDDDKITMEKFGITCEQKTIYIFEGRKYDRLTDAVKYAEITVKEGTPKGSDSEQ